MSHVWIDCKKVRETEKSVLLETDAGEVWCPKSLVGARKPDWSRAEVARWWAEKNGILDEKDSR